MKEYRRLELWLARMAAKTCRHLHLTSPSVTTFQVDIDGTGIIKSKSDSWVRNGLNIMASQGLLGASLYGNTSFFEDGYLNIRNSVGTVITVGPSACFNITGGSGSEQSHLWGVGSNYSIQIGSSDVVESFNDYKLGDVISHGNSDGQLYKNAQNLVSRVWNRIDRKWEQTLQRSFVNNGTIPVIVKEIGYYIKWVPSPYYSNMTSSSSNAYYLNGHMPIDANAPAIMIIRDVLPQQVVVNPTQTLTISYKIEYAF